MWQYRPIISIHCTRVHHPTSETEFITLLSCSHPAALSQPSQSPHTIAATIHWTPNGPQMTTLQTAASLSHPRVLHDAEFVETGASLTSGEGWGLLLPPHTPPSRHQVQTIEISLRLQILQSVPTRAPSVARAPGVSSSPLAQSPPPPPNTQGSMSFIGASIQTLNVFCPYP